MCVCERERGKIDRQRQKVGEMQSEGERLRQKGRERQKERNRIYVERLTCAGGA